MRNPNSLKVDEQNVNYTVRAEKCGECDDAESSKGEISRAWDAIRGLRM